MALLKPELPKPSKKEYCVRIEERLGLTMERYAEFLGATSNSYVISQALEFVFQKDADFRQWLRLNPEPVWSKKNHRGVPGAAGKQISTATDPETEHDGKQ